MVERKRRFNKSILIALAAAIPLCALLIFGAMMFYEKGGKSLEEFYVELGKLFLQLAIVAVFGALLKVIMDWSIDARNRLEIKRQKRTEFLNRVRKIYLITVNSKTLLKAHKSAKTYGEQLRRLMKVKFRVIEVSEDLKVASGLFVNQSAILEGLDMIYKFFEKLEHEYADGGHEEVDKGFRDRKTLEETIKTAKMKWVESFMNNGDNYKNEFVKGIEMSKVNMRKEIYGL